MPKIKPILGLYLIGEAPAEEDRLHNTDLIVVGMKPLRIGCRMRRHKYLTRNNYRNEFTLRNGTPTGAKTEITKIVEGWGDYIFYGFCNEQETDLEQWILGDLKVFRLWFNRELWRAAKKEIKLVDGMPGIRKPNKDGSFLRAFGLVEMPQGFIMAKSENHSVDPFLGY